MQDLDAEDQDTLLLLARLWVAAYNKSPIQLTRKCQVRAQSLLCEVEMTGVVGKQACLQCACEALGQLESHTMVQVAFRHWHSGASAEA